MKTNFSALALLSLLPAYTQALVGISWGMANTLSAGLKDITFPINMANATHTSGYYYAMQFGFVNVGTLATRASSHAPITPPGRASSTVFSRVSSTVRQRRTRFATQARMAGVRR